jgi:hypothetical protein
MHGFGFARSVLCDDVGLFYLAMRSALDSGSHRSIAVQHLIASLLSTLLFFTKPQGAVASMYGGSADRGSAHRGSAHRGSADGGSAERRCIQRGAIQASWSDWTAAFYKHCDLVRSATSCRYGHSLHPSRRSNCRLRD